MTQTLLKAKKKFFNSINYFRGLAIIIIVLGHSFDLAQWETSNSFFAQFIYSLSLNGTVYFVFISGFLYYHVFFHRFNYQKFLLKKTQYVLLPYILFSLIPILSAVFFSGGGPTLPDELRNEPIRAIIWYFCTGNIVLAYWYIPMAMLLYAVSPLVNSIIKSEKTLLFFLALTPISLLVHRPIDNLNAVHSLIYFFPSYLLGIWSSMYHKQIQDYLRDNRKKLILAILAIALGLIQILIFKHPGNFHKEFFTFTVIDVNLLQKTALCFLFISLLDRYENTNFSSINKVAETSFAIYFIHPFVLNSAYSVLTRLSLLNYYRGNIVIWLIVGSLTLLSSMAIAYGIKAVLEKKSRYLIGW